MKKLISALLLATICVALYTQEENLKKRNYFRIGLSLPTWRYFGWDDRSDWNDSYKRIGGMFEAGTFYMLNGLKLPDNMRLGINVDYMSVTYHRFDDTDTDFSNHFLFLGSKVGPSFSYNPVNQLVLDAYFKLNPVWASSCLILYNDDNLDDRVFAGFFGIKYSVGMNIRYSFVMLGFEYNPGAVRLKEYDTDEDKFTDNYLGNTNAGDRTPVPGFNITLGCSF